MWLRSSAPLSCCRRVLSLSQNITFHAEMFFVKRQKNSFCLNTTTLTSCPTEMTSPTACGEFICLFYFYLSPLAAGKPQLQANSKSLHQNKEATTQNIHIYIHTHIYFGSDNLPLAGCLVVYLWLSELCCIYTFYIKRAQRQCSKNITNEA